MPKADPHSFTRRAAIQLAAGAALAPALAASPALPALAASGDEHLQRLGHRFVDAIARLEATCRQADGIRVVYYDHPDRERRPPVPTEWPGAKVMAEIERKWRERDEALMTRLGLAQLEHLEIEINNELRSIIDEMTETPSDSMHGVLAKARVAVAEGCIEMALAENALRELIAFSAV